MIWLKSAYYCIFIYGYYGYCFYGLGERLRDFGSGSLTGLFTGALLYIFIYKLFIQDPIHYLPILVLAPTVAKVGAPIPRHFIWFIQTIDIYVDQYPDK